jgi:hypothetical protein
MREAHLLVIYMSTGSASNVDRLDPNDQIPQHSNPREPLDVIIPHLGQLDVMQRSRPRKRVPIICDDRYASIVNILRVSAKDIKDIRSHNIHSTDIV